jgi:hypothetical protein
VNMLADYTSSKDNKSFNGNFSNSHDFGGLNDASKGEIVNKYLVLKVILCWSQFSQIYDLRFNQKTDILDKSLNEKVLNWVNNIFLKTLESISNGNEASIYIHLMKCHQENFINLLKKIKSIKQVEFYQLLIEIGSVEIKEFENYYTALKKLTTFTRNNRYCNLKAYEEALDRFFRQIDYELYIFMPFNTFVKTLTPNEIIQQHQSKHDYRPVVIYLQGINWEIMSLIMRMNDLQRSKCKLFDDSFLEECKNVYDEMKKQTIEINVIINIVWPKTLDLLKIVADNIEIKVNFEIKVN